MVAERSRSPIKGAVDGSQAGYRVTVPQVSGPQLADHLTNFLRRPGVWGLVERLESIAWLQGQANGSGCLFRLAADRQSRVQEGCTGAALLTHWPAGRLFDAMGEWRWRATSEACFTVLGLSETRALLAERIATLVDADVVQPTLEEGWQVTSIVQHLVGSIVDLAQTPLAGQSWREVRNPHPLLYPLAHGGNTKHQPRMQSYRYAGRDGIVRFTRYRQLYVADIDQEAKPNGKTLS